MAGRTTPKVDKEKDENGSSAESPDMQSKADVEPSGSFGDYLVGLSLPFILFRAFR